MAFDLSALRLRALQRDMAASDGVHTAAPLDGISQHLKENSSLSEVGAATPQYDRIWRAVQQKINTAEEQRNWLHQHVADAEGTLAAAVTFKQSTVPRPRLGIPGASMEVLMERARALVTAQVEADEDAREHLKAAVASTHTSLWCSALQIQG